MNTVGFYISVTFLLHSVAPPFIVTLKSQLSENWCWAASAEMAMESLQADEDDVRQRIQAGRAHLPKDECDSNACGPNGGSTVSTCKFGGFPQFYKYDFLADVTPDYRPLEWQELWREFQCKRPVVFARENVESGRRNGSGHMVVAASASIVDGDAWIAIKDPAPQCHGSKRAETYDEYRGGATMAHWIDYFHLHQKDKILKECVGPVPPPATIPREGPSPTQVLAGFIEAIQNDTWIREAAGLNGQGVLSCDPRLAVPQKTISLARLRQVSSDASFDSVIEDLGRLRFLCRNGDVESFSVMMVRRELETWRVATMGDVHVAGQLKGVFDKVDGQALEEVFVQGLNFRFTRVIGGDGKLFPLSSIEGLEVSPESPPASIFQTLQGLALGFHSSGPT
jgi:hypothetical protein